ncbi:MAG: hypothetical protein A2Y82_02035 [Candidatus Buchananbacteria bacterium RBG_13_36_9]|uniref:Cell division protein FtsX n=1 Tax=Candidatus Buchananbacteria bacterium RBG_13_36_9 TaxID=1797530 RepID=A0A1G1XML3_9BACT|nr:MAG: hypothetical protein A2Y82_02035 [Candidatus Buchananbacteria bacterium RBG_13_36_9]
MTLTILILALFTVNLLIIFNSITKNAIASIESKININLYFKPDISEEQVANVQQYIQNMSQVEEVHYLSKDQALQNFKEKHKDDQKILDSLQEIDKNPLGASLIVIAKKTSDYPIILENLKNTQFNNMIESKDFDDHQLVIERITGITQKVSKGVIIIAAIFALISLLIIFNAIRIAIYTHRDEIMAMKLIGATDWFVETPFLLQGIIFAFISVIATIIIVYPLLGFIQPYLKILMENNFNIIYYFNSQFILIFGLEFLGAMILNLFSSFIAVKRYVRV